jgi:parvulin-like peptidyl-prolyl isomerase
MLKKLRNKKTAKKVWIILAILIIPAFVLWGSGSLIRSKQEATYAGRIFGRNISFLEYRDALDAVKNTAIMQFGDNFPEIEKVLNLESQAWMRIILLSEAKKRKISASDTEVIELIETYPFFQRKGQFDNRLYSENLRYVFHTQPRVFEEQTRQNLLLSKLYKQVTNDIRLNEEEIKTEYRKANEEISLYYIASNPSDFAKDINPSHEALKDYFAKNSLQFKQPLSFNVDYIALESGNKVKDAIFRLNKKYDFNKVAQDMGTVVKETGLFPQIGPIPGIGWSQEIINLLSKLRIGQYTAPIHMDKYYYIFRLKEIKEANIPDFEKLKDKVREAVIKDESTKLAKDKIESCLASLNESYLLNPNSINFNKTAKECGLKFDSTDYFKYGSYIQGIGASDSFFLNASKLKEDGFSDVIDMGPSGFYIIKLKSRIPIDEKKFEREKAEFSQKLLLQKKEEHFAQFVEDLKRKAQ